MSEGVPVGGRSGRALIMPSWGSGLLIWAWSLVLQVEKQEAKVTSITRSVTICEVEWVWHVMMRHIPVHAVAGRGHGGESPRKAWAVVGVALCADPQ